jgi:hypothetical protein
MNIVPQPKAAGGRETPTGLAYFFHFDSDFKPLIIEELQP